MHVLLSDIDQWQRILETTRGVWERADTVAQSDPELVRQEVVERLRKLDGDLQADRRDFELALKLDTIRQNTNLAGGGNWNPLRAVAQYPGTFRDAGYDIELGEVEAVAKRMRQSPIRYALVAALYHWAFYPCPARIPAILQQADDPDPWRERLFHGDARSNPSALEPLAADVDMEQQPPQILGAFAHVLKSHKKDAAPLLRRALVYYPQDYSLHFTLGQLSKNPMERIGSHRAALAVRPDSTAAHCNLASILTDLGNPDEAIRHCRKALDLDPNFGWIHNNLGHALAVKGDREGAMACFQKAVALDPDNAMAHLNLGAGLTSKGDYPGAIGHLKKAIDIDPEFSWAHYNLGMALTANRDLDGAVTSYRKAIASDPQLAEAHCNLAQALDRQGKFAEALAAVKRGHELGSKRKDWRYPSAQWLAQIQRRVDLDLRLPAVLGGQDSPADAGERLEMARLLFAKMAYADAARFYAGAFKDDPNLSRDLRKAHRYNAACAAALAIGAIDDGKLSDPERTLWLEQTRAWLNADLDAWTLILDRDPKAAAFIKRRLRNWQTDPDLIGVRDEPALAKLPAEAQRAYTRLWADVAVLLKRAESVAAKEDK